MSSLEVGCYAGSFSCRCGSCSIGSHKVRPDNRLLCKLHFISSSGSLEYVIYALRFEFFDGAYSVLLFFIISWEDYEVVVPLRW